MHMALRRFALVGVCLALAVASINAFKMGWEVETDGSVMRPGSELSIKTTFHSGTWWKLTVDDPKGKYQKCFPTDAMKNGKIRLETGQDQSVEETKFREVFRFRRVRSRVGQGQTAAAPPPPPPPLQQEQKPKKSQEKKVVPPKPVGPRCNYGFIELVNKPIPQNTASVSGAMKEIGKWWKNTKTLSKSSITVFGFGTLGFQSDLLLSTIDAKVQFTAGYSLTKLDKLAAGDGPLAAHWLGFNDAYKTVAAEVKSDKAIVKNFLAVWYWVFSKYVSIEGDHIGKGQMNVNVKMDFCEWIQVMKTGNVINDEDLEKIKAFMNNYASHKGLVGEEKKKKALGVVKGERQCFMISTDNTRVKPVVENGDVDVIVEYRVANSNMPCFSLILDVYKNPAIVDDDARLNRLISRCLLDLSFPGIAEEIIAYNKVIKGTVKSKESMKDADVELSETSANQADLLQVIEKMESTQVQIGDAVSGTPEYTGIKSRVNKIKELYNRFKLA